MISLIRYFDFVFFKRFIILLLLLYYFPIVYQGVTLPGGRFYSSFLSQHLNFIQWIRLTILLVSNQLVHFYGLPSYIEGTQLLRVYNGEGVEVWLPCLGLGLMSFWVAFVCAHQRPLSQKIAWCLLGIFAIWLINCFRIALLLVALQREWKSHLSLDHHDFFNIAAYVLLATLFYFFSMAKEHSRVII